VFSPGSSEMFPEAVQQVSSDRAPSSGINLSFLRRMSSSLITLLFGVNFVAGDRAQLSSQFVACVCMHFGFWACMALVWFLCQG